MTLEEIQKEIMNYPTPVTGCDAYFNWLLEERNRLENLVCKCEKKTRNE